MNEDGASCTGTFIARNWILTAAHCLSAGSTAPLSVHRWASYDVFWFGAGGHPEFHARFKNSVLQNYYPTYLGFVGGAPQVLVGVSADVALLYIYWANDTSLPPNPSVGSAMRVSIASDTAAILPASGDMFVGAGLPSLELQTAPVDSYLPFQRGALYGSIFAKIPSLAGAPLLCHGDSGGPLVSIVPFGDPLSPSHEQVILATLSGTDKPGGDCIGPGGNLYWMRADVPTVGRNRGEAGWIESVMGTQLESPSFRCHRIAAAGQSVATVAECWAPPCFSQLDCLSAPPAACLPNGCFCSHFNVADDIPGQCLPL